MPDLSHLPTKHLEEELKKRKDAEQAVATVRMPLELMSQIKARSKAEDTSINQWIINAIKNNLV